jgi:hypothetical protein
MVLENFRILGPGIYQSEKAHSVAHAIRERQWRFRLEISTGYFFSFTCLRALLPGDQNEPQRGPKDHHKSTNNKVRSFRTVFKEGDRAGFGTFWVTM